MRTAMRLQLRRHHPVRSLFVGTDLTGRRPTTRRHAAEEAPPANEIVWRFCDDLDRLRVQHGSPSYRTMAARVRHDKRAQGSSVASFTRILSKRQAIPTAAVLNGFLVALGLNDVEIELWHDRRRRDLDRITGLGSRGHLPLVDDVHHVARSRRRTTALRITLGVAMATLVAAAVTVGAFERSSSPRHLVLLSGRVTCATGVSVEGVWVQPADGKGGWAQLRRDGPSAAWQYSLEAGATYHVHVGCGGSPKDWASANYSAPLNSTTTALVCTAPPRLASGFASHGT